jgi:hypothetical protein
MTTEKAPACRSVQKHITIGRLPGQFYRSCVVEAADLLGGKGCDERLDGIERLEPLLLQHVKVDRHREIEPREVFRTNSPAPPQQLQQGQRREAGVLATGRPAQSSKYEHEPVEMEHVQNVTRFVAAGERERLVDREIDGMEYEPDPLIAHRRHESPG